MPACVSCQDSPSTHDKLKIQSEFQNRFKRTFDYSSSRSSKLMADSNNRESQMLFETCSPNYDCKHVEVDNLRF